MEEIHFRVISTSSWKKGRFGFDSLFFIGFQFIRFFRILGGFIRLFEKFGSRRGCPVLCHLQSCVLPPNHVIGPVDIFCSAAFECRFVAVMIEKMKLSFQIIGSMNLGDEVQPQTHFCSSVVVAHRGQRPVTSLRNCKYQFICAIKVS